MAGRMTLRAKLRNARAAMVDPAGAAPLAFAVTIGLAGWPAVGSG
jgi:hypothetical protein